MKIRQFGIALILTGIVFGLYAPHNVLAIIFALVGLVVVLIGISSRD